MEDHDNGTWWQRPAQRPRTDVTLRLNVTVCTQRQVVSRLRVSASSNSKVEELKEKIQNIMAQGFHNEQISALSVQQQFLPENERLGELLDQDSELTAHSMRVEREGKFMLNISINKGAKVERRLRVSADPTSNIQSLKERIQEHMVQLKIEGSLTNLTNTDGDFLPDGERLCDMLCSKSLLIAQTQENFVHDPLVGTWQIQGTDSRFKITPQEGHDGQHLIMSDVWTSGALVQSGSWSVANMLSQDRIQHCVRLCLEQSNGAARIRMQSKKRATDDWSAEQFAVPFEPAGGMCCLIL